MERISGEKKKERKKNLTDRVASEERVDLGSRGREEGARRDRWISSVFERRGDASGGRKKRNRVDPNRETLNGPVNENNNYNIGRLPHLDRPSRSIRLI